MPHKTWNHPTSTNQNPFLPKKPTKETLPCLFSPGCRRLFRVSIGQVSADEAERNVIPFNATFVAMNGDFMIEQPWNLEQPGIWQNVFERRFGICDEIENLMENGSFYQVSKVGYIKYPFLGGIDMRYSNLFKQLFMFKRVPVPFLNFTSI